MAMPDANTALQRWRAGTGQAQAKYTSGVQNSADWAGAYTAAVPQMGQAIQAALAAGRFEAGAQRIGTQGWRQQTVAKAGNWGTGVNTQQAQNNYLQGYQIVQQVVGAGLNAIASLPKGSYADRRARANAYMDAAHAQANALKGL